MSNEPTAGRRARRHALLDISLRKQKPGSGSRLTAPGPPFERNWPDLSAVLEGLRWAIVGAVATRYYMPERATGDLDIAVAAADLAPAHARLEAARFAREGDLSIGGSSWRSPDGIQVDVIDAEGPWWPEAFDAALSHRDEHGCPLLTLPYLVLMKSLSMRPQDTADVSRMLGLADEVMLDEVRRIIARYSPADAEDLESMITLGKLEHQGQ